jgi:regulator of protease activity HflC (stomatin/prohibitin superfamily)
MEERNQRLEIVEKNITPNNGGIMLISILVGFALFILLFVLAIIGLNKGTWSVPVGTLTIILSVLMVLIVLPILCGGLKVINPNEAIVLTFFGKYYGTISTEGFFFVNPFCSAVNPTSKPAEANVQINAGQPTQANVAIPASKKISLKAITLNNAKQKVNDLDGNPIEIGVVVIWKVVNASKAVFNVDNYISFVSTQCDSAIRQVARSYPYDVSTEGDEKSLRGSSREIAEVLKQELQGRTEYAGIEILEARISHLAYAPEIAAAMLQRQQASALIDARQKIVEGAVGMVEMALNKLSENNIVVLDDERKAQMVSNLLVVLCGNKDAQPIVNSGSIY